MMDKPPERQSLVVALIANLGAFTGVFLLIVGAALLWYHFHR